MTVSLKVVGSRICHAITVTRFMQPMPMFTLPSPKLVLGYMGTLAPPTQTKY